MHYTVTIPDEFADGCVSLRFDQPMSDLDFMDFCRRNEVLKIERASNGDLIVMSPVGGLGATHEYELALEFGIWARADGRGRGFGSNGGFTLADGSVRAADVAWIRGERWNQLTPDQQASFPPICPDFIIEMRSKSDGLKPLQDKMRMWLDNGADLAWLIDPQRKMVEVYRPGEEPEIHDNPTSVQGSGPVASFELVLSRIWG